MNVLQTPWAVVGVGLAMWLGLIVVSNARWRLARGYPLFRRSIYPGLPYPSYESAQARASDRRAIVIRHLDEFARETIVTRQLLETPPVRGEQRVLRQVEPVGFEQGDPAGYWHGAKLRAQLAADEYLLAERVSDVLVRLRRAEVIGAEALPNCVRVEPIDCWTWEKRAWYQRSRGIARRLAARIFAARRRSFKATPFDRERNRREGERFPWRVVIESRYPRRLAEALAPLESWLGIGVDFLKPTKIVPRGRCVAGTDGGVGLVGGIVRNGSGEAYGITCQHVLSSQCMSLFWPQPNRRPTGRQYTEQFPDAAFLTLAGPCFVTPGATPRMVPCGEQSDIAWARSSCAKLNKAPSRDRVVGMVQSAWVSGFEMDGHVYDGPHILITPRFVRKYFVVWPLWRRQFSRPGDSGTGVVAIDPAVWLGIVVGSAEDLNTQSYVLTGHALLDVFSRANGWPPITHLEVLK